MHAYIFLCCIEPVEEEKKIKMQSVINEFYFDNTILVLNKIVLLGMHPSMAVYASTNC